MKVDRRHPLGTSALAALAVVLAFIAPAEARPGDGGGMGGHGFGRGGRMPEGHSLRNDLRDGPRQVDAPGTADGGERLPRCEGPCRMSPQERQKLRRDIGDAGRELYRRGPRGLPPPD
jgi:hypothetical protein